jgi:hypothetical protein
MANKKTPKYLFSAPYKIGFAQNGVFWPVSGDFCRNSREFHLAFGEPNRNQHKKLRNSCAEHGKRLKNRSLNPKIGVAENRKIAPIYGNKFTILERSVMYG